MRIAPDLLKSIKLNIGGGSTAIPGFTTVDRSIGSEAYPLEYSAGSVAEIRASHILEHFDHASVPAVLADWVRVLEPGGRLRLSVPDFDLICDARRSRNPKWRHYLMGGQIDANDFHHTVWVEDDLRQTMRAAGLVAIDRWSAEPLALDTASNPISLNLEGVKGVEKIDAGATTATAPTVTAGGVSELPPNAQRIKIACLTSMPRVGFNEHWGCLADAVRAHGIPVRMGGGVYWSQSMQRLLEEAVVLDLDWVLTVDYDSMFNARDVGDLLQRFAGLPAADALCGLQTKRNSHAPLFTRDGSAGEVNIDGRRGDNGQAHWTPFEAKTAHFGFTIFRIDALRKMPRPWFWHLPDARGGWDESADAASDTVARLPGPAPWLERVYKAVGLDAARMDSRLDADIFFWHQFGEAGHRVFVDPNIRVGHLELKVSGLDGELKPTTHGVSEWRDMKGGKKCGK